MQLRPLRDQDEVRARLRGPMAADDPRVLDILRRHYLTPPSTRPYNLFGTSSFTMSTIEKLYSDRHHGFFVEAGAYDGERISNTLHLEKDLGWTGLLIEPDKENYRKLLTKHRKAWTTHSCLSTESYPKEDVLVSLVGSELIGNDRRYSSYLHGIKLNTTLFDDFLKTSEESYSVVQCFPLVSYLLALNVSTVDFLSLDIQGAEKDVLRNIPWDNITIRAMVVEEVHYKDFNHQFVEDMKNRGYVLVAKNTFDYIFVKEDDTLINKISPLPTPERNVVLHGNI